MVRVSLRESEAAMTEKTKGMGERALQELCQDRSIDTPEIFQWNAFYGFDRIIKKYVGLPSFYSLKGVWPHGLLFNTRTVKGAERDTSLDTVFCYPPYRVSAYQSHTDKIVIPAAHPILYLLDMMQPGEEEREGTLFFPQHSTHHVTAEMNYRALAHKLTELDDEYRPVTVCLYWKDVNMGRAQFFRENGFPVVSAGHMFDPEFLSRFCRLCAQHEYAAGNSIGSHIFYSVASGCSYFHVDGVDYELDADEDVLERDTTESDPEIVDRIEQSFGTIPPAPKAKQKKEANYFLGARQKKSRAGLLADLAQAEFIDKFRVSTKGSDRISQHFPAFWKRALIPKLVSLRGLISGQ